MFDLYITDYSETERLDLVYDFQSDKDTLEFEWEELNDSIEQQFLTITREKDIFKSQTFELETLIHKDRWEEIKSLLSRKQSTRRLKLFFGWTDNTYVTYIKHRPNRKVKPFSNTDYLIVSLEMEMQSYFYEIKSYYYTDTSIAEPNSAYPLEYGTFVYGEEHSTGGNVVINNIGDDVAPFRLVIKGGGIDLEWRSKIDYTTINLGKLFGVFNDDVIIDTLECTMLYQGREVKQFKNPEFSNFFTLPVDNSIFSVFGGYGDYELHLYVPYITP